MLTVELIVVDPDALVEAWYGRVVAALSGVVAESDLEPMVRRGFVAVASGDGSVEKVPFSFEAFESHVRRLGVGELRAVRVAVEGGGERPSVWRFGAALSMGDDTVDRVAVGQLTASRVRTASLDALFDWAYRALWSFADIDGLVHGRIADGAEFSRWERNRFPSFPPAMRGHFYPRAADLVCAPDWGLLLGPGHLAKLGNGEWLDTIDALIERGDAHQLVGVRATPTNSVFAELDEDAWAERLAPVLWQPEPPQGRPRHWDLTNGPSRHSFPLLTPSQ